MTQHKLNLAKQIALKDLEAFIALVHPLRYLGSAHKELIKWWTRPEAKSHQLVLLPRDHQKSALVAYRVAWELTRNPAYRVLYISSTSKLATKQLHFIKQILTCDNYRRYWPEMVHPDESKREKWTETEISLDHPQRKKETIRDPSIFTAGLTTNIVGLHCDIAVMDDVVVDDSAYSPDGRAKVRDQVSYLASILSTDGRAWAVGTRYHPRDLYDDFSKQIIEIRDPLGDIIDSYHLYEIWERQVETAGDGSGIFLWPKAIGPDGKWRGFDQAILASKRAQYNNPTKFRAQYYNDPNDLASSGISPEHFQYYEGARLRKDNGSWYYSNSKLNIFASVDFAYSVNPGSDFTAIVVVGMDAKNNYYVLDIDRFKTKKISDYFSRILRLQQKWDFRKLRAETTAAQAVIVQDLKENYIKPYGLALSIDDQRPTKKKEERIDAILQPKYSNLQVWHAKGGYMNDLEEELIQQNPPHDDIKDALASAIEIAIAPNSSSRGHGKVNISKLINQRFGGIN